MANAPDGAVRFLLQNVDFIMSDYRLSCGAGDSRNKLVEELSRLKEFLQEYTGRYYGSSSLDTSANTLRNLFHRAEDAVETFIVETARQDLKGKVEQMDLNSDLPVSNLVKQIEEINKEIDEVYVKISTLGFAATKYEKLQVPEDEAKNLKLVFDDTVVGLQDEIQKVIHLLTKGKEDLHVITIVGVYGFGKTTLAKKVFDEPQIESQFCIRVFVEVSQDFKKKEVFLKIINSVDHVTKDIENMSEDKLGELIKEYLGKRNYLIVLDNVRSTEAWDQIKYAFPNNNKRSKVLMTSTEEINTAETHKLRFLEEEKALDLLRIKVFDNHRYRPADEFQDLEIRLLKKCKGQPLAIVLIAGMLRSHPEDPSRWVKVVDGVKDYDPHVTGQIDRVIELSFDLLPYDLKPCFLYLGVFPKDSEISAHTLLRLWVSEGLIPSGEGEISLEEIAAFYLQNLINRSLVKVQKRSSTDQVKTIKIDCKIHEFCKRRARKETLFLEINGTGPAPDISTDDCRLLCINSNLPGYFSTGPSGKSVRSFMSFAEEDFVLPLHQISSIPKAFKLLRVLEVRSIKFTRFPADIFYLILLKYIAIHGDFSVLPVKMSNLLNLQTLIVQTSAGTTLTIKADIWKMAQLRHIETNATAILPETKEGLGKNANLQTLSLISAENCKREVFERTPMLKKLGVRGNIRLLLKEDFGRLFLGLEKLENLKLLNETPEKIHVPPSWEDFPRNLEKLTLLNTLLDWEHMSTLGELKNLQVLKLKDYAFEGPEWNTTDGGFKSLKVLHIGKTNLEVWKASSSHFPVLTRLYIKHCSKLHEIPEGLLSVSTLEMIDLYYTNNLLISSAKRFQGARRGSEKQLKLSIFPPDQ